MSVPTIRAATPDDIPVTAAMVQELLSEIMAETGLNAFETDHATTERLLTSYIETGSYIVFVASVEGGPPAGFIGLTPCGRCMPMGILALFPNFMSGNPSDPAASAMPWSRPEKNTAHAWAGNGSKSRPLRFPLSDAPNGSTGRRDSSSQGATR